MAPDEKSVMTLIRASRPTFRNAFDKVAFAVHSSFLASGYILTFTGSSSLSESAFNSSSSDEVGIDGWNDSDEEYVFVYTHPEKGSKKVWVKCLKMNDLLLVDAFTTGGSEPVHVEFNVDEFVEDCESGNYSAHYKNLSKLVNSLDKEILSKIDGSGSSSAANSDNKASSAEVRERSRPEPSGPEDPYNSLRGVVLPPINPGGGSDLFPGPGAGVYPNPWRGDAGSGGMLIGPNDPRWFGGGRGPTFPGGPGVPGARFDPYGPPDVPGFEPGRFVRDPRRPRGGTHPDLEHFGSGSDFI
ncbi:PI31 proteasome regulator, N-terminal [Dillenia turbinata]|uniref:PI31 proteasome regulator, N-terminal n=1 Tax=Dillenia turbinata TaxID=194707 RepID=A0AAN8ZMN0_9MAGN